MNDEILAELKKINQKLEELMPPKSERQLFQDLYDAMKTEPVIITDEY